MWYLESIRSAREEVVNAEMKKGFFCAIPVKGQRCQASRKGPCTSPQLQTSSVSKSTDAGEQNLGDRAEVTSRWKADHRLHSKSVWVKGGLGKGWAALEEQTDPAGLGPEQQVGFHHGVTGLGWKTPDAPARLLWKGSGKCNRCYHQPFRPLVSLKPRFYTKTAESIFWRPLARGQRVLDSLLGESFSYFPWCEIGRAWSWWIHSKQLDRLRSESTVLSS